MKTVSRYPEDCPRAKADLQDCRKSRSSPLLKILAGSARGRVIQTPPKSVYVRPMLARIKKSLFDILAPRIGKTNFLDLYAGTGSVGIEALSRGAAHATFVDDNGLCLNLIRENLKHLNFLNQGTVVRGNASSDLGLVRGPFNLIFTGPPYRDGRTMLALTAPTIKSILVLNLLTDDGWIIAQHHKKEANIAPIKSLDLFRQEFYGDSVLSFFRFNK